MLAITLSALQRCQSWHRIGVDAPYRRRERHPQPVNR
jgi:hypothetical protein